MIKPSGPIVRSRSCWFIRCPGIFEGGWVMDRELPAGKQKELESLSAAQVDELLVKLKAQLPPALYEQVAALLGTYKWVMGLIEKKKTTMRRLQRLIFGAQTEKTDTIFPKESLVPPPGEQSKGHGRIAPKDYPGPKQVKGEHPKLNPADPCP